ncbi:thiamine-phosphate pyrophosphorylase [Candidatus Methylomirabilis lanthanidiphila]|uniref:Thiamine-phosphate synthase n=1 Tax=Candidatus Methylomirabilis lanthanidiphila TaxID=2211376 RepID=A0A564ZGH3_9BACT|nr:thiamine phosphate synthase [Candidatus Methylomirabilis lanthanidiphila]VUZ84394.1 thiamine-phosphate pyrophosphorylase [Candidatus Methylomirabilis lanthanidiphila]
MISSNTCRLCVITDPSFARGLSHFEIVARAVAGGASMIQLRDKVAGPRQLLSEARRIAQLCRDRGVCFIVNDRLDLALAADADGVHLGQDDLPPKAARAILSKGKLLGVSTHSVEQALEAAEQGADYLGIGPIFATGTKATGYEPKGCDIIRQLRARIDLPLIAIGGITLSNVGEVIQAGATGAAVISAIVGADDITAATAAFSAAIHQAAQPHR